MKLSVLSFFLFAPLLFVIIESCDPCVDSCCGTDFSYSYFEVDGVDLVITNHASFKYNAINVIAQFDRIEVTQQFHKNSIWVNEAYGCQPPEPMSRDTLQDIRVIANNDYNADYLAGTLLNDIISIEEVGTLKTWTINEYLANLQPNPDYYSFYWLEYVFNFSQPPSDTIEHAFTVEFVFEDKIVIGTTEMMKITP